MRNLGLISYVTNYLYFSKKHRSGSDNEREEKENKGEKRRRGSDNGRSKWDRESEGGTRWERKKGRVAGSQSPRRRSRGDEERRKDRR